MKSAMDSVKREAQRAKEGQRELLRSQIIGSVASLPGGVSIGLGTGGAGAGASSGLGVGRTAGRAALTPGAGTGIGTASAIGTTSTIEPGSQIGPISTDTLTTSELSENPYSHLIAE